MAGVRNVKKFRTMIISNPAFRKSFADDPKKALKSIGIDVPAGVTLPAVSKTDLDKRVADLRSTHGANLPAVLKDGGKSLTGAKKAQFDMITNLSKFDPKVGGSGLYKLSVAGTVDW